MANKIISLLKKDVLALAWIVFIAAMVVMTVWFQSYIKDLIILSILFILFFVADKYIVEAKWLAGGAPRWKRFPIFFAGILILYFGYNFLQTVLTRALPAGGINIVFVGLWLVLLFLMYSYKIILD